MSELLAIGQTCSHLACSLVDFLPIKCQHCTQPFCSDHYKPQAHSCSKFDASKYDRVAPACPFCQKPVAFAAGVDPNLAMEAHFENTCEVVRGGSLVGVRSKAGGAGGSPRCARGKCNKVLVAPIRCPSCSQQFCAEHRFPTTHKCIAPASSTPSSSTAHLRTPRASTPSRSSPAPATSAPRQNAALAAMNRAAASVSAKTSSTVPTKAPASSKPTPIKAATASSSTPITNPFSKTERWGSSDSDTTSTQHIDDTSAHSYTTTPPTQSPTSPAPHVPGPAPVDKPQPIIPQSFIPRSIFGTA